MNGFFQDVRLALRRLRKSRGFAVVDIAGAYGFSLDDVLEALVYGKPKLAAVALTACALLGFALAMVGLFSLMSYMVSLKTHDIGIRLALGAPTASLSMMLKRGRFLIAVGALIGIGVSTAVTRFLTSLFHGVSAYDPLTYILVAGTVVLAGLSACFLPARRAANVDPMTTLSDEWRTTISEIE
jgi:ABC-type antimicrobial peptide transport system permease subunit